MNTVTKQITINMQHEVIGALDDCATACEGAFEMLGIGEAAAKRARKAAELMRAETNTPDDRTVAKEDTTSLEWLTTNAAFDMYAVTERLAAMFDDLSPSMTTTQRAEMLDCFKTLAPFMLGMKQRAGNDTSNGEEPVQEFARFYERIVQASLQSAKRFVIAFDGLHNGMPRFKVVARAEKKGEGEEQKIDGTAEEFGVTGYEATTSVAGAMARAAEDMVHFEAREELQKRLEAEQQQYDEDDCDDGDFAECRAEREENDEEETEE